MNRHVRTLMLSALAAAAISCASSAAHKGGNVHQGDGPLVMLAPEVLEWKPIPSLPPGASMTLLEGDPSKEGLFAMRLRLPPNFKIPPHFHPTFERITVLQGTFYLGHGETWNEEQMAAHAPGSYVSMPPGMRHFAGTRDEETIVQLVSMGPWGITYVNPADDPRAQR